MLSVDGFHDLVLGKEKSSFKSSFESEWQTHLSSFPDRYDAALQLRIGSRFRPCLVAWGYLLAGASFEPDTRSMVAKHAVYVELLHKATLLIDDLIDDDSARHGQPAFHVEFNANEAILFAIYLLGDCMVHLASSTGTLNMEAQNAVITLLGKAIRDMAAGGIEESRLTVDELSSVSKIKRIIELQTIVLVKNGLLVGYHFGRGDVRAIERIDGLGHDAAYLFQVLNDLEPFYGSAQNDAYKGRENSDFTRLKKNFVVAKYFEGQSAVERKALMAKISARPENARSLIQTGLNSQGTLATIGDNLRLVRNNIDRVTQHVAIDDNRKKGFSEFVDFVLGRALSRLEDEPRQMLSEILIK